MNHSSFFKSTLALLVLSGIFIFSGCRKEYPEPPVDYLPQDFKDWMFFKEGTYWVYQDSASGILDSTVVTSSETSIESLMDPSEDHIIKKVEYFMYYTTSYPNNQNYRYTSVDRCMASAPNYQTETCLHVNRARKKDNYYSTQINLIFYNYQAGQGTTYVTMINKYDSLQIGNRTYKDVVLNWQSANNSESGVESWYYLAKGIGIVQIRERYNGKINTQKLVRYHIEE